MKNMKSIVLMAIVAVSLLSSCQKEDLRIDNASLGVQIGGVRIQLSYGSGYGNYWGYGNIPTNVNTSVAYVVSKPLNSTAVAVFDQNGNQLGTVDCCTGDWKQCNAFFSYIQNWNYSAAPYAVLIQWDQKFTSGPWTGHIVG